MKSVFKSKTAAAAFLTSAAGAAAVFIPSVGEWVQANAAGVLIGLGVLNIALRLVTKDKVSLFPDA